jgi:hypothetical protein
MITKDYKNMSELNAPQLMWIDVITAVLSQSTFDVKIGNMGYVFKNMIAKYVSSADYYRISLGAFNELIKPKSRDRIRFPQIKILLRCVEHKMQTSGM